MFQLLLYFLGFYILYSFITKNIKQSSHDPPGLWELPILGSLHKLGSKPHINLARIGREIGGGIYRLWMGESYAVVVSDPQLLREVWLKNNDNFLNRPVTPSYIVLTGNFTNLVSASNERWYHNRALVSNAFTKTKLLKSSGAILNQQVVKLMDHLSELAIKKEIFSPRLIYKKYSMNIISNLVFSHNVPYNEVTKESKFGQLMDQMDLVFKISGTGNPADYIGFLKPFFFFHMKLIGTEMDKFLAYMKVIYDDHMTQLDKENPRDLFDMIIIDYGKDDLNSILRIGIDLLLAGTDTSSSTLEWVSLHLANNPHIQEKAYKELSSAMKQHGQGSNFVDLSQRPNTPYVNAILKETLRLNTIAPLSLPRVAKEGMMIGSYYIPKGTTMIANLHALHTNPDYYPNPMEFIPERFVNDNHTEHFLPFSIGARNCVGKNLAEDELYLALANLIYNFSWKSVSDLPLSAEEEFGLTVHPLHQFELKLEKRIHSN